MSGDDSTILQAATDDARHEPTAWMRARLDRQAAALDRLGLTRPGGPLVVAPLGERLTRPGTREDRTCDRCGTYCPDAERFVPVAYQRVDGLVLVGGLCGACDEREVSR